MKFLLVWEDAGVGWIPRGARLEKIGRRKQWVVDVASVQDIIEIVHGSDCAVCIEGGDRI